jgi:hypothetical protein
VRAHDGLARLPAPQREAIEAATHTGERALAEQAFEQLAGGTRPVWTDWALAVPATAQAQVREGDEAQTLYREAIKRFEHERIPVMVGRCRLLYGEVLNRRGHAEAREQLRAAHEVLTGCGLNGFAERAARQLGASGESLRVRAWIGCAPHQPGAQRGTPRARGTHQPGHRRAAVRHGSRSRSPRSAWCGADAAAMTLRHDALRPIRPSPPADRADGSCRDGDRQPSPVPHPHATSFSTPHAVQKPA